MGDSSVYKGIKALISSIICNSEDKDNLNIFIITDNKNDLHNYLNENICNKYYNIIEIDNYYIKKCKQISCYRRMGKLSNNSKTPQNIFNFLRFYIQNILPNDIDKVIYLDTDMIVRGDLKEIYNNLPSNKEIGVVYRPNLNNIDYWYNDNELKSKLPKDYLFNAGFFIANLTLWRKNNKVEDIESLCIKNKMKFLFNGGTQPIQNIIYNSYHEIDSRYNVDGLGDHIDLFKTDYVNDIRNGIVLHWTGENKPWLLESKTEYEKECRLYYEWYKYYTMKIN